MQCREAQHLLDAYVDGYTDVPTTLDLQQHLAQCWQCQQELALEYRLRRLLTAPGLWEQAPTRLRQRIQRRLIGRHRLLLPLAMVALVLLGLTFAWGPLWPTRPTPPVLVQLLEAATQNHQGLDPAVSDTPSPEVGRLHAALTADFPYRFEVPQPGPTMRLLGGASCTLQGIPCRAVFYEHRGQRVSYVVFPYTQRPMTATPQARVQNRALYAQRSGKYHVVFWPEGPVICALVADLPLHALLSLAQSAIAQEGATG